MQLALSRYAVGPAVILSINDFSSVANEDGTGWRTTIRELGRYCLGECDVTYF